MIDHDRLARTREALFGPGAGRTTTAVYEAWRRLLAMEEGAVLFFVVAGPSAMISHAKGYAATMAEHLHFPLDREGQRSLFASGRELRFVTAHQFMHGPEMLGRSWNNGKKGPDFIADPAVLEQLWLLRKEKP